MLFEYKVLHVGVSPQQDQEDQLNRWAAQGWVLDRVMQSYNGYILLYLRREVSV